MSLYGLPSGWSDDQDLITVIALGHASTSITADTYAHVAQEAKRTALGVVSDALGR